ncbi:MAG: M43 family zinc metalloprotease [Bacteroidota bacterium]
MLNKLLYSLLLIISCTTLFSQSCGYQSSYYPRLSSQEASRNTRMLYVAVVVHLIESEDGSTFISNQQVLDQISALNRDFNQQNHEWRGLPNAIKNTAGKANITFYLAQQTPSGEPTNGITRTTNAWENMSTADVFHTSRGGHDAWPTDQYLNIWVADLPQRLLGFASSPLDAGSFSDGVVLNKRVFGLASGPFSMGRSLVHEVGHYLGLLHPWGHRAEECQEDDGVQDTPPQYAAHFGCPPRELMGCETARPSYWNFMDYTPDCCMALFTHGQIRIMRDVLQQARHTLVSYGEEHYQALGSLFTEAQIVIYPNPAMHYVSIDWSAQSEHSSQSYELLQVYDQYGRVVINIPLSPGRDRTELCVHQLPAGSYSLFLLGEGQERHHAGRLVRAR